ncbi:hypothetical protein DNTS_008897 [Danionella cerebrum]|uniref:Uncharacterized protein n=1 Tax=Danionella cerebrum TaxID=2873325 RepID=A0A553MVU5_9TELE|nr:hypothetical protein DNTS_008897 [Danionella translucida]
MEIQQKSRIKQTFGVKDFEAQFIQIRKWEEEEEEQNSNEAMVWIGSLCSVLGAGSLDQFRIRIRIRIMMDAYMERDQFTGNGNRRRGTQPKSRIHLTKLHITDAWCHDWLL